MQTTCAPCPIGYYKNKRAPNKECAKCACNMGTPKEGATKCISKYFFHTKRAACVSGKHVPF